MGNMEKSLEELLSFRKEMGRLREVCYKKLYERVLKNRTVEGKRGGGRRKSGLRGETRESCLGKRKGKTKGEERTFKSVS